MRKTNIVLGLGLVLSLVGAQASQAQQQADGRRPEAGQQEKQDKQDKRGRGGRGEGRGGPGGYLLRGVTLTDAQKTQLKALHAQDSARFAARRDEGRKAGEALRAARQQGDTAAVRRLAEARRAEMTQERDRRASAIRGILTAEQRVAFDKNVAEAKARDAQRGERGERGKGFGRRGGERGGQGGRGQGGQGFRGR